MMRRTFHLILILFLIRPFTARCASAPTPQEVKARQLIAKHLKKSPKDIGIVVGLIDDQGTRIVSDGGAGSTDSQSLDGDTVFEIGSITKALTSLILADMVQHGELKLDDPVSRFLPPSVRLPSRNGREITLVDLATHTSGLPRMPDNFSPRDPSNPYADYTVAQMYEFLSGYTLPRDIGARFEYSNLGAGLLGHALALKARTNYEALVLERICRPLGMTNTRITLTPTMQARLAKGHDESGKPAANWDIPTFAGAGALRSTANDLLKFLAANLGFVKTDLQPAMELARTPRHEAGSSAMQIGLGFHILKKSAGDIVWHNGGTGGYHSFMGFDNKNHCGVVVLSNSAADNDDIGFALLSRESGPPKQHVAINLAPGVFDAYLGRYEFTPGVALTMSRQGDRMFTQMTGQSRLEILPESETEFFLKGVDAQLTFEKDSQDHVTDVILHQNGLDQTAKRIQ
jgi:serine-type D-Ala-D-Ala carboxypeptidase/endopeptidase